MKASVDALRHEAYEFYRNKEYAKAYIKTREKERLVDQLKALGELESNGEIRRR